MIRFKTLLFLLALISSPSWALPDATVDTPTYDQKTGVFTCLVHNIGVDPIPTVTIGTRYTVDGVSTAWGSVPGPLAAGGSIPIGTNSPTPYTILPDGPHTINYWVDDLNRFAESDETNNHYIYNIVVDTVPPLVSITSPVDTSIVSGNAVELSATATDLNGVVGVQYAIDGTNLGIEDTVSPYNSVWDTTGATNANHVITATSRDAAGNISVATVTVTVNNLPDLIVLPTATYDPIAMTFSATVQNIGTSGTVGPTTVGVKYSVDGVSKTWGSLPGPIDINQTMILPQTGPAYSMPVGTHSVDVFVDDVNRFVESNEANNHYIFSVTISPPADTIPPSVPTGLIATPFSNTQVNLSWEASTDNVGVTGYTVWRDGVVVGSPIGLTFSDTGLGVCSSHNYQITAHDTVPNISAKSVTVPATTTGCTNADYDIQGFAKTANVTGGNGGTQITISSTSDANITGTLRYALGQTGSRYIKFAPGMNGTINNSTAIIIGFGNVTLDGAGANVDITGNSLYMGVNNIIIKNLRFPNTTVGYCAISVDGHAKNIWIDHNTFSNNSKNDAATGDPVCFFNFNSGAWDGGLTGSTISWNKFMEPNMKAIVIGTASSGPHGGNDAVNIPLRVSLHHNWYHLVSDRTPRIEGRTGAIHAWNNYHYWWEPQPGNPSPYPGGAVTTGDNGINFLSENDIYEAGPIDKATTSWNNYPASLASSLNVVGQWSLNGPTYSTVGTFPRSMIDYTGYPLEIANDALRQRIIAGAGKKL